MKKSVFLILIATLSTLMLQAQNPLGDEGNQFKLASGYNINGLPIYINYEMGVTKAITFGLEGAFRSFKEKSDTITYNHSIVGFSFFSNYYFNEILHIDSDKWFLYAGLNLGYYKWFSPDDYLEVGKSSSTLTIGIQIGGIVYFKDWGIFLEVVGGTENAGGKLGVAYRFDY